MQAHGFGVGIEVHGPSIHGPEMNIHGPGGINVGIGTHGPEMNVKGPGGINVGIHGPEIKKPELNVGMNMGGKMGVNVGIGAHGHGPDLNIHGPQINVNGPSISGPNVNMNVNPNIGVNANIGMNGPSVKSDTPLCSGCNIY